MILKESSEDSAAPPLRELKTERFSKRELPPSPDRGLSSPAPTDSG
jgi:hypothetical protein